MKLWSNYVKEMKIASRGFYFYIEIIFAVITVAILLFAVNEESVSSSKEYIYYKDDLNIFDKFMQPYIDNGTFKILDDTEFEVGAIEFEVVNEKSGEIQKYKFDSGKITAKTFETYDEKTGKLDSTIYKMNSYEDMLRMSYTQQAISAVVSLGFDKNFKINTYYDYYIQGYETDRYKNLLYVIQNESPEKLAKQSENQKVRILAPTEKLNARESIVPVFLAFAGSIMGMFIIMAYIFLDKDEGVIKAFAVSPAALWKYLLSKIGVILTTVTFSSAIITIPVMGAKPDYLQLLLFLFTSTFAMASLGMLISSFFNNMTKAFGVIYAATIILMLPMFSFYIPSFDPLWLRFFPTYSMLQGYKEILLNGNNLNYTLLYSSIYLSIGLLLFILAKTRFRKTLTV